MSERDRGFMRRALHLAERGWGQTAPNPMVGAVLVRDDRVVGEGWHERYGEAHAEVNAIRRARGAASGAHLYVTLEPCTHHGRTPPCVPAIIASGVRAVTVAALDPTAAGGGAAALRAAGVDVTVGCEGAAARELNAPFHFQGERPWVTLKLALSVEGALAPAPAADGSRRPTWLTGEEAGVEVHRLRAGVDAIAVGVGTVLCDDPLLTVRHYAQPRVPPLRVVFDRRLRTPASSRLVRTAGEVPTLIVAGDPAAAAADTLRQHGVEVIAATGVGDALRQLRTRGVRSLLVEGGAMLAGALLDEDCVDRLILLQSPTELGAGATDAFQHVTARERLMDALVLREEQRLGADVMRVYALAGHDV